MSEEMRCIHFVGFNSEKRPDQFRKAVAMFGKPDFEHKYWDMRAKHGGERGPLDVFVFASGDENSPPNPHAFNDSDCV